jgi:DNA-binding transcriptional regulator YdaS (Cro superfamily)
MNKADVIAFFGNQKQTAIALGISEAAVSQWGDAVPGPRQGHVKLAMEAEASRRAEEAAKETKKAARKARKAA